MVDIACDRRHHSLTPRIVMSEPTLDMSVHEKGSESHADAGVSVHKTSEVS